MMMRMFVVVVWHGCLWKQEKEIVLCGEMTWKGKRERERERDRLLEWRGLFQNELRSPY